MVSRPCDRDPLAGTGPNSEAHVMTDRPRRSSKRNKPDSGSDEPVVVISVGKKENNKRCRHGGCERVFRRLYQRTDHERTTQHQSEEGEDPEARCNMVPCGQEEGECQVRQCPNCHLGAAFVHSADGCRERMHACRWGYCNRAFATTEGRSKHEKNTRLPLHE